MGREHAIGPIRPEVRGEHFEGHLESRERLGDIEPLDVPEAQEPRAMRVTHPVRESGARGGPRLIASGTDRSSTGDEARSPRQGVSLWTILPRGKIY